MLAAAAVTAGASHPAVAALLGLGAAGLAGAVVAMAWNVHTRQIQLAEQLARRQFIVTADAGAGAAGPAVNGNGGLEAALKDTRGAAGAGTVPPVIIDGPETVVTGEQARYRVRPAGNTKVVSWAVGGGAVSQAPDPAHPDELLLIADRPGDLTVIVRAREGMAERRATKPVTAVADVTAATMTPPITLRLFLHGWGLVAVAVLIVGFAGALAALGSLTSSDFIALVAPLAALLGVVAAARTPGDAPHRPANGKSTPGPRS